MKLNLIFAAGALLASAAHANTSDIVVQDGPSARVQFADLDLHSAAGRQKLLGRINSAAELLCSENNVEPIEMALARAHCRRVAVASGIAEMNRIAG